VLLGQGDPEEPFEHRGEPDARQAQQPTGQLGVEQPVRPQAELREARQVLRGRVQDPLDPGQGLLEDAEVLEGLRVDQPGARALALELDQEGALAVAEARGALGVDGDRSRALGQQARAALELLPRDGDERDAAGGLGDEPRRRGVLGSGFGGGPARVAGVCGDVSSS